MLKVIDLRCEYKENPVGIDVLKPRMSWKIMSDARNTKQTAYQLQVSKEAGDFGNIIWDTGRIEAEQSIHIEYEGPGLISENRYYYRVCIWDNHGNTSGWSEAAYWETALLLHNEWKAQWITTSIGNSIDKIDPSPYFRKEFELKGKISRARIYSSSLGMYQLYLNGEKVGAEELAPGWTTYSKRLQYQTYDVTEALKEGGNALGIILGEGWYKGTLTWEPKRNIYGDKIAAILQLHVTYEDGSREIIHTDTSWNTATGPIILSGIYDGETYDARLEMSGWCTFGYDSVKWVPAAALEHTKKILVAQENVPVRIVEEIKPTSLIKTPKGETVIDFGQNMVGWVEFSAEGKAGDQITIRHAEVLDKNGNFYTDNLRTAKQIVQYTMKGSGKETFRPHLTFFGFRYIKIEGYPAELDLSNFMGLVLHSDMEQTGSFQCSNEKINQLQHNILWGQKGNFVDVPTDCPQRDERLGWTGDAQVFVRTAAFNMNVAPFFTKWLRDLRNDQTEEKGVPFVIPNVLDEGSFSSAAWGDAATICPWVIFQCYGDKRLLAEQYDSMKAWVEYIRRQGDNEYLWTTGFHFGDWLDYYADGKNCKGITDDYFIASAFYAYSTNILIKAAKVLEKEEDIRKYTELYENIVKEFRKEFVTQTGRIAASTQTAQILPLMFDLLEERDKKRAADTLAGYLKANKYHLTTGFVGTPYICSVLADNGYIDIAYKLVMREEFPSWLYQVNNGATTIWEHWDGIKEDGSFWEDYMNSFNHYAYGSIGDWLYKTAAGIDMEEPGYKRILIRPIPGGGLSSVKAGLKSIYGDIESAWELQDGEMKLTVKIPANTAARVILPSTELANISEGGKTIGGAAWLLRSNQLEEGTELELGSGEYSFSYFIK